MDTRLLRLAWRHEDFPSVRCWEAPDGTTFAAVPADLAQFGGTTEVQYWVPGIAGMFFLRPNLARHRGLFRRIVRQHIGPTTESTESRHDDCEDPALRHDAGEDQGEEPFTEEELLAALTKAMDDIRNGD